MLDARGVAEGPGMLDARGVAEGLGMLEARDAAEAPGMLDAAGKRLLRAAMLEAPGDLERDSMRGSRFGVRCLQCLFRLIEQEGSAFRLSA